MGVRTDRQRSLLPSRDPSAERADRWDIGHGTQSAKLAGQKQKERRAAASVEKGSRRPVMAKGLQEWVQEGQRQATGGLFLFRLGEHGQESVAYMALRGGGADPGDHEPEPLGMQQQPALEIEVQRLLQLPPEEIDRRLRTELEFMPPTSKAASGSGPFETPPTRTKDGLSKSSNPSLPIRR